MDEQMKAIESYDDFELEYNKTLELLMEMYPRHSRVKKDEKLTENVFRIVINSILSNVLKELQIDSTKLTIKEFHKKYVPNLPILYRYDFSSEDFKKIIDHSYLCDRDKKIAYKEMSQDIGDKKTIDNNLESINNVLLHVACVYNKENNNNNKA